MTLIREVVFLQGSKLIVTVQALLRHNPVVFIEGGGLWIQVVFKGFTIYLQLHTSHEGFAIIAQQYSHSIVIILIHAAVTEQIQANFVHQTLSEDDLKVIDHQHSQLHVY